MKAILLCGGSGSRLFPLTKIMNKCMLPLDDKPMIYHPIQTLVDSGITDILLVCGGNKIGQFLELLGNGEQFGLEHLQYTVQEEALGIAHALGLARHWAEDGPVVVMLSDNIFEDTFAADIQEFENDPHGAKVYLTEVWNPTEYGCPALGELGEITEIEEKPKNPKSNFAIVGLYFYDSQVWDMIDSLEFSDRNELEISDINSYYLNLGQLQHNYLKGWWADAGDSHQGYLNANLKANELRNKRSGL